MSWLLVLDLVDATSTTNNNDNTNNRHYDTDVGEKECSSREEDPRENYNEITYIYIYIYILLFFESQALMDEVRPMVGRLGPLQTWTMLPELEDRGDLSSS